MKRIAGSTPVNRIMSRNAEKRFRECKYKGTFANCKPECCVSCETETIPRRQRHESQLKTAKSQNKENEVDFKGTRQVAEILGVRANRLQVAIWNRRIPAPIKGPGNAFLWTNSDIENASQVLLHKPYLPVDNKDNG